MTSVNPRVAQSTTRAPRRSRSAFVATVVPWTIRSTCDGSNDSSAVATASLWSAGVLSTLRASMEPDASMATRSVKVPPTSTPTPMRLTSSQADFLLFFGGLVNRLEHLVQFDLIGRRLVRCGLLHHRGEVRELRPVRLQKRALASRRTRRRDISRAAVELFHHAQRREPPTSARGEDLEPPALFLADVRVRDIDHRHHSRDTLNGRDHRFLDRDGAPGTFHRRGHPLGLGSLGQPEREIEEGRSMIEERAASRLRAPQTPSLVGLLEMVCAGADARDLPQLAAVDETGQRLAVGAEPM